MTRFFFGAMKSMWEKFVEKGVYGLIALLLTIIGFLIVTGVSVIQGQTAEIQGTLKGNTAAIRNNDRRITVNEIKYDNIQKQLDNINLTQREILKELRTKQ